MTFSSYVDGYSGFEHREMSKNALKNKKKREKKKAASVAAAASGANNSWLKKSHFDIKLYGDYSFEILRW